MISVPPFVIRAIESELEYASDLKPRRQWRPPEVQAKRLAALREFLVTGIENEWVKPVIKYRLGLLAFAEKSLAWQEEVHELEWYLDGCKVETLPLVPAEHCSTCGRHL